MLGAHPPPGRSSLQCQLYPTAGYDCLCMQQAVAEVWKGRSRHRHHEEEETSPAQQVADRHCAALTPSRIGTLLNSLMYIRRQFPAWSQCALGLLPVSPLLLLLRLLAC